MGSKGESKKKMGCSQESLLPVRIETNSWCFGMLGTVSSSVLMCRVPGVAGSWLCPLFLYPLLWVSQPPKEPAGGYCGPDEDGGQPSEHPLGVAALPVSTGDKRQPCIQDFSVQGCQEQGGGSNVAPPLLLVPISGS